MHTGAGDVKRTADEWYEFPGDVDEQKPGYWVARHGRIVTSQIEDDEVEVVELHSLEHARAEFADATCDPDGPGGPVVLTLGQFVIESRPAEPGAEATRTPTVPDRFPRARVDGGPGTSEAARP